MAFQSEITANLTVAIFLTPHGVFGHNLHYAIWRNWHIIGSVSTANEEKGGHL